MLDNKIIFNDLDLSLEPENVRPSGRFTRFHIRTGCRNSAVARRRKTASLLCPGSATSIPRMLVGRSLTHRSFPRGS